MDFVQAHKMWLQSHLDRRNGERKGRLERGHGHGERLFLQNVWWPLYGHFEHLHPEYEVLDWRGQPYFADMAWLPGAVKMIFEIKGFGPHVRDMDRKKYSNELNRELFMQAIGYRVVSLAYDDVEQRPELCRTLLRLLMSKYQQQRPEQWTIAHFMKREIVYYMNQQAGAARPKDVADYFSINHRTAVKYLGELCDAGWLAPCGNGGKITRYKLGPRQLTELVKLKAD
ncbi:hypothetical protein [Paenibacillus protaetiae]|uniref:DUF559 domain-containing protein n=1 Tax=Paenibacillus protaetiae TaxID=2509456 RepID=A0A4P6F3L0_9BACL|nr:hypothetical protein [Paenibacillus protaetiae]QAY67747.1 hypothetical protein ET464_16495 [Paenibacillus protaetiae]